MRVLKCVIHCISITTPVPAHNKAHPKLRESHANTCSFYFTKNGKNFQHTEMHCCNKQKAKNEWAWV